MSHVEKRTISLPPSQAVYIDTLVERGGYSSASEVVRAGLRALQERDAIIERWLKEAVVPVCIAMDANPERGIPADEVVAAMDAYHLACMKNRDI